MSKNLYTKSCFHEINSFEKIKLLLNLTLTINWTVPAKYTLKQVSTRQTFEIMLLKQLRQYAYNNTNLFNVSALAN